MNIQWTVSRQEMMAAMVFASKDEDRYALNMHQIVVGPGKQPKLVTCDGKRLCVIESTANQEQQSEVDADVLLLPGYVKAVIALSKQLGGKIMPLINFETTLGRRIVCSGIGAKFTLDVEEGAKGEAEYPNWRRIIPSNRASRSQIDDLSLNAQMIGDYAKAAEILGVELPVIHMNLVDKAGAIETVVHGLDQFYSLMMPCSIDEEKKREFQPEFVVVEKYYSVMETAKASQPPKKQKPEADVDAAAQAAVDDSIGEEEA